MTLRTPWAATGPRTRPREPVNLAGWYDGRAVVDQWSANDRPVVVQWMENVRVRGKTMGARVGMAAYRSIL